MCAWTFGLFLFDALLIEDLTVLGMPKWADNYCLSEVKRVIIQDFSALLSDVQDERPVQDFLAAYPQMMACLLPPGKGAWCFDRPRFGSEFIPDFLLCTHTSAGYKWIMIELESPTRPPLTKAGVPSNKLAEAQRQVRDWRAWLRQNISYAQGELQFIDLTGECVAYIIIGRRMMIHQSQALRYRELSDNSTIIMTYDRLIESV